MLRRTLFRCAGLPTIRRPGDLPTISGDNSMPPVAINTSFGVGERSITELARIEEEKRVARHYKNFEDMIVFEGGQIKDKETLGNMMIMRDFVHYALHHPKWGYFPKLQKKYREHMTIGYFDPVPYGNLRDKNDYELYVGKISETTPTYATPPALFQPYYGWVLAEYMITTMRAKFDPSEPLIIYDIGAGTGTLAVTILNFLAEQYPDVYHRCEYHLIDMSPFFIPIQRTKLVNHMNHVHIHNISFLNWRELEPRRCFCIAMEVMSGMPHDAVFWTSDGSVHEQWVQFEEKDNLAMSVERSFPAKDPLILRYLRYCQWLQEDSYNALKVLCVTDGRENILEGRENWKQLEPTIYDPTHVIISKVFNMHDTFKMAWLPVAQMLMLETMAKYFPRHHSILADWNQVLYPIMGYNAPVVQVKVRISKDLYLRRTTDHFLANAGMVDCCFPTDFDRLTEVYKQICGDHKEVNNMTHPDFWKTFGGDKTSIFTTNSGYNPLLEDFKFFSVFASHHPPDM